ncbi:AAA family ATPase [Psychrobacillus sp. FSL K6-2836]|uniref:AAA family ATPase n=1 Tax=Psychrobacillus sp. FSL K6-2836 TaxID=2921548 RepID=UPI0030FA3FF6
MKINELEIHNINSITSLQLKFQPGVNILCGTNGTGKTTILECINNSFSTRKYSRSGIRRTVDSIESSYSITVSEEQFYTYFFETQDQENDLFRPDKFQSDGKIESDKFIYQKITQRNPNLRPLVLGENGRPRVMSPFDLIKGWFYRCYFQKKDFTEDKYKNLVLAKRVFSQLDPNVTFNDAIERTETQGSRNSVRVIEIMVETPKGIINMDFLSSGYKACFSILIGIIRSIEETNHMAVESFDGIVLIDEIDLHLHPEWQSKIVDILKWLIPNAQIIITTHSPHVIQNASPGEIIPLGIDENNRMFVRNLPESNEYGYQGWTIEEILVYVMGLSDPKSKIFREKLKKFEQALDDENIKDIKENYKALSSMIHPRNSLGALLRIQAEEFFEDDKEEYE